MGAEYDRRTAHEGFRNVRAIEEAARQLDMSAAQYIQVFSFLTAHEITLCPAEVRMELADDVCDKIRRVVRASLI
jgi:hypothetical protein